ncbi:hypothetical protein FRC01_005700 [Tulasnella sp. 417]|nr:hypothetical protein FRC01_005700 [Tulasnella sp. 417]
MAVLNHSVRPGSPLSFPQSVTIFALCRRPSDDVFRKALQAYAKENGGSGLSTKYQILRLKKEFGLDIGKTSLFKQKKRLGILTTPKSGLNPEDEAQVLITLKEDDPAGSWSVAAVKQRLAMQGAMLSRQVLLSTFYKCCTDGHEKLNDQALEMGGLNFGIYAAKDGYSTLCMAITVMPNVRSEQAIAHFSWT